MKAAQTDQIGPGNLEGAGVQGACAVSRFVIHPGTKKSISFQLSSQKRIISWRHPIKANNFPATQRWAKTQSTKTMYEFALDQAVEKIPEAKTKLLMREVLSGYFNENYRSASVMLWTVIVCDVVFKMKMSPKGSGREKMSPKGSGRETLKAGGV